MHIPYLQQSRTGIYYFRLVIPKALRASVGRRELRRSLRTRDLPQAILRMRRYLDEVPYALQERQLMSDFDKLKQAAARNQFELKVTRNGNTTVMEGKADPTIPDDVKGLQDTMRMVDQATQAGAPQAPAAPPAPNTPAAVTTVVPQAPPLPSGQAAGSVMDYFEAYRQYQEEEGEWTESTALEYAPKYQLFEDLMGKRPVTAITPTDAEYFRDRLKKLPSNFKKRFGLNTDPNRAIALAADLPNNEKKLISDATLNKNIQALNGLFTWLAEKKKIILKSPFLGLRIGKRKGKGKRKGTRRDPKIKYRRAYSTEELTRLFSAQQYIDHVYNHPYQYWLMLIGLYSGARINEICQLFVSDIKKVNGILVFDFNEDDAETTKKSIKSDSSERLIPVHSKLIDLGFKDFVKKQNHGRKSDRLFPELKWYEKGNYGKYASQWFNGSLKQECGFGTCKGDDFHTFRATAASFLRNEHQLRDEEFGAILGHANETVSGTDYADPYAIKLLKRFIELLDYEDALKNIKPYKNAYLKTPKERRSRKKVSPSN